MQINVFNCVWQWKHNNIEEVYQPLNRSFIEAWPPPYLKCENDSDRFYPSSIFAGNFWRKSKRISLRGIPIFSVHAFIHNIQCQLILQTPKMADGGSNFIMCSLAFVECVRFFTIHICSFLLSQNISNNLINQIQDYKIKINHKKGFLL